MQILLVRPQPGLLVERRLEEGFLHLEPLDLEIVAGGVPESDEVAILDLSRDKDPFNTFQRELSCRRPDLVALTGYSTNVAVVKRLAGMAKRHNRKTKTVAGGVHATLPPKDYASEHIDIVAGGEGRTLFRELIPRLKAGDSSSLDGRMLSTLDPEFDRKAELPPPEYPDIDEIPSSPLKNRCGGEGERFCARSRRRTGGKSVDCVEDSATQSWRK